MSCAEKGPDLVALALGQLAPAESGAAQAHLRECAACRRELAAARALVSATRAVSAPEPASDSAERLLAAVRAEAASDHGAADLPPPARPRRRAARILALAAPLAAAAAIVAAVTMGRGGPTARVVDGEGFLHTEESVAAQPGVVIRGAFDFAEGDEVEAGLLPFTLRLALPRGEPPATSPPGGPEPGSVEIRLSPGARLERTAPGVVRLVAGTVEVVAGPLADGFEVSAPPGFARVRGTRFAATTSERRLVVRVDEGSVELGRTGGPSETLAAGHEGLVDADRLLTRRSDGRRRGEGLLAPRLTLEAAGGRLVASLSAGEGGPVSVLPFDGSEPRFLLRLKGGDGREREVKLQRSMLAEASPESGRTVRLEAGRPYALTIDVSALGLAPGRHEARVRYLSYRARSDGAEWLGVAESESAAFEVPPR